MLKEGVSKKNSDILCHQTSKTSIDCKFEKDGVSQIEKYTMRGKRITRDADSSYSSLEGSLNYAGMIKWGDGSTWTKDSKLCFQIC